MSSPLNHEPGRWKAYRVMNDRVPTMAGVYAIYLDGVLVYIGSSVDLANRFCGHSFRYGYAKCIRTPWVDVPTSTAIVSSTISPGLPPESSTSPSRIDRLIAAAIASHGSFPFSCQSASFRPSHVRKLFA